MEKARDPMKRYSWVTSEMFDEKLAELLDEMGAGAILQIPGVYECVSEYLNNEVLESLESERAPDSEPESEPTRG